MTNCVPRRAIGLRPELRYREFRPVHPSKELWVTPTTFTYSYEPSGSSSDEAREYMLPLAEVFRFASTEYREISIDTDIMAGAPCIAGTRIPVYMVLDSIEYHGSLDSALNSYPQLTMQQIKEAIGFAKLVVECPIDDRSTPIA